LDSNVLAFSIEIAVFISFYVVVSVPVVEGDECSIVLFFDCERGANWTISGTVARSPNIAAAAAILGTVLFNMVGGLA
jgi:hypothetical protein